MMITSTGQSSVVLVQREQDKSIFCFQTFLFLSNKENRLWRDSFYQVFLRHCKALNCLCNSQNGMATYNYRPNDNSSHWAGYPWRVAPHHCSLPFDQPKLFSSVLLFLSRFFSLRCFLFGFAQGCGTVFEKLLLPPIKHVGTKIVTVGVIHNPSPVPLHWTTMIFKVYMVSPRSRLLGATVPVLPNAEDGTRYGKPAQAAATEAFLINLRRFKLLFGCFISYFLIYYRVLI